MADSADINLGLPQAAQPSIFKETRPKGTNFKAH